MSNNAAFLSTGIGSVSECSWTPEGAAMSIMSPFVSSERGSSPLEWSEGDTTKEGTSRTMTMAERGARMIDGEVSRMETPTSWLLVVVT